MFFLARQMRRMTKEANQRQDSLRQPGKTGGHRGGREIAHATKAHALPRSSGQISREGGSHCLRCRDCGNEFPFPSESPRARHFARMGFANPIRCFGCIQLHKRKQKEYKQKECKSDGSPSTSHSHPRGGVSGIKARGPEKQQATFAALVKTTPRQALRRESEAGRPSLEKRVETSTTADIKQIPPEAPSLESEADRSGLEQQVEALIAEMKQNPRGESTRESEARIRGLEQQVETLTVEMKTKVEKLTALVDSLQSMVRSLCAHAEGGQAATDREAADGGSDARSPEGDAGFVGQADEGSDSSEGEDSDEETYDQDRTDEIGRQCVDELKALLGGDGPRRVTQHLSSTDEAQLCSVLEEMLEHIAAEEDDPEGDYDRWFKNPSAGVTQLRDWGVRDPEQCRKLLTDDVVCAIEGGGVLFTRDGAGAGAVADPRQFCGDLLAAIDDRPRQPRRHKGHAS